MEWSRFAKVARSVLNINNPISAITISGGKIMSVSPLSSHLLTDSSQQQWKIPFEGYVKQLASALQSGDLSEAQTTYAKIQQILQAN